jgi:hypothetical protein
MFESHESIVFPSVHTVRCDVGGYIWERHVKTIVEFLRWLIATGHLIRTLKLSQWSFRLHRIKESDVREQFHALQDDTGLVVIFE